jgi:hypothetical protein
MAGVFVGIGFIVPRVVWLVIPIHRHYVTRIESALAKYRD